MKSGYDDIKLEKRRYSASFGNETLQNFSEDDQVKHFKISVAIILGEMFVKLKNFSEKN